MSTQAVVSVRKAGNVVLKIVSGDDGGRAPDVAAAIRAIGHVPTIVEAVTICAQHNFGSPVSLVIMGAKKVHFEGNEILIHRYRQTFGNPTFNPRVASGEAEFIEVVDFE